MKIYKKVFFVFFAAMANVSFAATVPTTDLTTVFSGIEKDCADSNKKAEVLLNWLVPNDKGKLKPVATAPISNPNAFTQIKVEDQGDAWKVKVTLDNATYRDIPIVRIDRWSGKENGIAGFAVYFSETKDKVAKKLGKIGEPGQLMAEKGTNRAVIWCDFPN